MFMETSSETARDISLLEQIEHDPDVTQASLAAQLGVAVGTVNWHLKRLIAKGYVKVKRAQRRKLRYIITPEGIAFRARLTVNYIESSLRLYRRTRQRVRDLLGEIKQAGYERVIIRGEGDIADICRLTCLEQNIRVVEDGARTDSLPILEVRDMRVHLILDKKSTTLEGELTAP
jgi:DNA-binding MarR family transcriptional regulator